MNAARVVSSWRIPDARRRCSRLALWPRRVAASAQATLRDDAAIARAAHRPGASS